MSKDANSFGHDKALAWESRGFVYTKKRMHRFDTPSLSCPALIAEATMNKGFEEIYEGMRVNRENFCLECVFISEIELAHIHTVKQQNKEQE